MHASTAPTASAASRAMTRAPASSAPLPTMDPAAVWWGPSSSLTGQPPPEPTPPAVPLPRGSWIAPLGLVVLALGFTLAAPICWFYSNAELARIEAGELAPGTRGLLRVSQCVGAFLTVFGLVGIATLVTYLAAR